MLEIAVVVFLIITAPYWIPILWGLVVGLLGFGFMVIFWSIFLIAIIYLIFFS